MLTSEDDSGTAVGFDGPHDFREFLTAKAEEDAAPFLNRKFRNLRVVDFSIQEKIESAVISLYDLKNRVLRSA